MGRGPGVLVLGGDEDMEAGSRRRLDGLGLLLEGECLAWGWC